MSRRMIVVVAVVMVISQPSRGQDVAGALTLGGMFKTLMDRVDNAIELARESGRAVVIQAGSEARVAIANAEMAYGNSLNKSRDAVDTEVNNMLQHISLMVSKLERDTGDDAKKAMDAAQLITNTLPFSKETPQLRVVKPAFVSSSPKEDVAITMLGNFPQGLDQKPYLELNGNKKLSPAENTTLKFKFLIPPSEFKTSGDNRIHLTKARFVVPYETGGPIGKARKDGVFLVILGTLPPSPGKIVLHSKKVRDVPKREHKRTQTWQQHSSNDDLKDRIYESPTHLGWQIDPTSVQFVREWSQGDENDQWSKRLIGTDGGKVVYSVTTIYHRIGTSGKVNFHLEYDIVKTDHEEYWKDDVVDLRWGQSKSFMLKPGDWKVIFDSFDGRHQEYLGVSNQDRYLKLTVENTGLTLSIPEAAKVSEDD